jgi:RNA polymerase sigma-70 factor (ECF subfamily)
VSEPVEFADAQAQRLLERYLDGDTDAFGILARGYYDRLWAVALRMSGGDPDEAADALQDAFIAAMRGARGFRGDAKVSTWLHRIVVNACLDRHRRRKRRAESAYADQDDRVPDPTDHISNRELAWDVERALARLPDDQRAAIILVDVEGWPVSEAASILGVPPGTVKSRCSRGRAKLATDLSHLRNPGGADGVQRNVGHRGAEDGQRKGGGT